jgi:hypothetical protein
VLVAKYGNHILHEVDWSRYRSIPFASTWWKNIVSLDKAVEGKNWFLESMVRKVGNGVSTSFWHSKWIGDVPLAVAFPRLFSISNQQDLVIKDFLVTDSDNSMWAFSWRRNLFQWEEDRGECFEGPFGVG